jgi:hypothetical protein
MWTRVLAVALIVGACVTAAHRGLEPRQDTNDQLAYLDTVHEMRDGVGYYPAMEHGLEREIGPVESTRAFRTPTIFWFWSALPSDRAIWYGWLVVAGLCGLLTMAISRTALTGPAVTILLLLTMQRTTSFAPSGDQWMLVEAWVLPFALGTVALWQRGRFAAAAACATAAVLVRETTGTLLLGGLLVALLARRGRRPWLVGTGVALAFAVVHRQFVQPHLVAAGHGTEAPFFLTGAWDKVLEMVGYGIPGGWPVGLVLWIAALTWMERQRWTFARAYLLLPLIGFFAQRPYWGVLVLPFTVAWGADGLRSWVTTAWPVLTRRRWASRFA